MAKRQNPWLQHVAKVKKDYPELSYKEVLMKAKETYSKRNMKGGLLSTMAQHLLKNKTESVIRNIARNIDNLRKQKGGAMYIPPTGIAPVMNIKRLPNKDTILKFE